MKLVKDEPYQPEQLSFFIFRLSINRNTTNSDTLEK